MSDEQDNDFIGAPRQPKSQAEVDAAVQRLQDSKIQRLEEENKQLRETYERDCTPAFEEVCMRNQSLNALLEKKQRLLELACEEHGHDWRGDGDRCARCGISDHLAQYTPCDDDQVPQAGG